MGTNAVVVDIHTSNDSLVTSIDSLMNYVTDGNHDNNQMEDGHSGVSSILGGINRSSCMNL